MSCYLAIDTATPACSAALWVAGKSYQRLSANARKHTEELLPMIAALFQESGKQVSDLNGILLSAGPGAFTGLRVGAAVALGLATAADCPILPLSSLAVLAESARIYGVRGKVVVCLDARMEEVYAGYYALSDDNTVALAEDGLFSPAQLLAHGQQHWQIDWHVSSAAQSDCVIVGSGLVYPALNQLSIEKQADIALQAVACFAWLDKPNQRWQRVSDALELFYLRDKVTQSA